MPSYRSPAAPLFTANRQRGVRACFDAAYAFEAVHIQAVGLTKTHIHIV